MNLRQQKRLQPPNSRVFVTATLLLILGRSAWAQEACPVYFRLLAELQNNFAGILGKLDEELSDSEGKYYASRFTMPGVRSKDDCHVKNWTPSNQPVEWEYSCEFRLKGVQGVGDVKKAASDFASEIAKCTGGKLIHYGDRDYRIIIKTSVFGVEVRLDDIDFTLRKARPREEE